MTHDPSSGGTVRPSLVNILRVGFSLALLTYVFSRIDLDQLLGSVLSADLWLILSTIPMIWIAWSMAAMRWHVILRSLGWEISATGVWAISQTSQFFALFLPGQLGGELSRWMKLAAQSGEELVDVAVSIVVDRLVGLTAMIMIGTIALWAFQDDFPGGTSRVFFGLALFGTSVFWIVVTIGVEKILPASVRRSISGRPGRRGIIQRRFGAVSAYRGKSGSLLRSLLWASGSHVVAATTRVVITHSLGLDIPAVQVFVVYIVASVLTMIPVSISGLGIREFSYVQLFREMGYSSPAIAAIPLLAFLLNTVSATTLGGGLEVTGGIRNLLRPRKSP